MRREQTKMSTNLWKSVSFSLYESQVFETSTLIWSHLLKDIVLDLLLLLLLLLMILCLNVVVRRKTNL